MSGELVQIAVTPLFDLLSFGLVRRSIGVANRFADWANKVTPLGNFFVTSNMLAPN